MKLLKENRGFCITASCIFVAMLLLNALTPMMTDDYTYSFVYTSSKRLQTFGDVFTSLYNHYGTWAGRSVIFFFLQMSLLIGKWFFNIVSAIICIFLSVLIVKLAVGTKKMSNLLVILSALGVWFLMPAFGETMLWMTGACNYLWVTVIVLAYLLPLRYLLDGRNILQNKRWWILWFLFGIVAGWCNETVSGVCALFVLLTVAIMQWVQKQKIPLWVYIGFVGNVIGLILLLAAPGNARRTESLGGNHIDLTSLESRLTDAVQMIYNHTIFLYVWFAVFFAIMVYVGAKKMQFVISIMLLICSLAGNFAMILSPYFPERAMFTGTVFALIACVSVTAACINERFEKALVVLSVGILVIFAFEYYITLMDTAHVYVEDKRRTQTILEEIEVGNTEIVVEEIKKEATRNAWEDMKKTPNEWPNIDIARYYEIDTIQVK